MPIDLADTQAEQIRKLRDDSSIEHEFTVILTPRRNLVTSKIFEDAGLLGDVRLETFPLYFLPLDQDLLSLELNNSFADLFLVSRRQHSPALLTRCSEKT